MPADIFFFRYKKVKYSVLHALDHLTHFQIAVIIPNVESKTTRQAFSNFWVRTFGPPSVVMTDPGTEFLSDFSRLVEQIGSVHHLIDVEAPWQNGRCERHGGVLKRALYKSTSAHGFGCETSSVDSLESSSRTGC